MRQLFLLSILLAPVFAQQARPDFSGVWTKGGGGAGGGSNNSKLATQWGGEVPSYTPEGLARFNENKPGKGPRQIPPALGNDPLGEANPPGLYRTLIYNRPFEFVQTGDKVVQLFEWAKIWRVIWTDGRPVPEDVDAGPYWYGYSVGKWEGDTLVVETLAVDDRSWMDEWGTSFSSEARFTERWKKTAADRIEMTLTVNDPGTFTKPWTSAPITYTRRSGEEVLEMIFAPMDERIFNERIRDPAAGK
jgi:hypothetical protein